MAEIPIEVWKFLGDMGVCWLANLFNKILSANKMPSEWKTCTLIPMTRTMEIFKIIQITMELNLWVMSHTMKLWARVIEHKLRHETVILDNQFDLY